jgi:hypothetical protein
VAPLHSGARLIKIIILFAEQLHAALQQPPLWIRYALRRYSAAIGFFRTKLSAPQNARFSRRPQINSVKPTHSG